MLRELMLRELESIRINEQPSLARGLFFSPLFSGEKNSVSDQIYMSLTRYMFIHMYVVRYILCIWSDIKTYVSGQIYMYPARYNLCFRQDMFWPETYLARYSELRMSRPVNSARKMCLALNRCYI